MSGPRTHIASKDVTWWWGRSQLPGYARQTELKSTDTPTTLPKVMEALSLTWIIVFGETSLSWNLKGHSCYGVT